MTNKKLKKELLQTVRTASFPYLIHIYNEDLGDFYYCNYHSNIEYQGHTYLASCFEIDPPDKTQSKIGNASLSFSVVNTEWIEKIRTTQKRSKIEFVGAVIYEDGTVEPIEENEFTLTVAQWTEDTLSWDMIFDEDLDILVPCDIMNGLTVPACL